MLGELIEQLLGAEALGVGEAVVQDLFDGGRPGHFASLYPLMVINLFRFCRALYWSDLTAPSVRPMMAAISALLSPAANLRLITWAWRSVNCMMAPLRWSRKSLCSAQA